jgi:hypothetical protein
MGLCRGAVFFALRSEGLWVRNLYRRVRSLPSQTLYRKGSGPALRSVVLEVVVSGGGVLVPGRFASDMERTA